MSYLSEKGTLSLPRSVANVVTPSSETDDEEEWFCLNTVVSNTMFILAIQNCSVCSKTVLWNSVNSTCSCRAVLEQNSYHKRSRTVLEL